MSEKKIREKIYDHQGNSFFGTNDQVRLYKAGWRLTERRKMGCVWKVRWMDMWGNIWNQGTALEILKSRKLQTKVHNLQTQKQDWIGSHDLQ